MIYLCSCLFLNEILAIGIYVLRNRSMPAAMELVENVAAATTAAMPMLQTVAPDAAFDKLFIERALFIFILLLLW